MLIHILITIIDGLYYAIHTMFLCVCRLSVCSSINIPGTHAPHVERKVSLISQGHSGTFIGSHGDKTY